jgi:hypothetical protein
MADQSVRTQFENVRPTQWEQKDEFEEGSLAMVCFFTFVGTAAATLLVCGLTPAKPIPQAWQQVRVHHPDATPAAKAKGASAASGLSVS